MNSFLFIKKNFILILWLSICLSIGVNPDYIFEFSYNLESLFKIEFLKIIRIIFPLLIGTFWFILIIKDKIKLKTLLFKNLSTVLINLYFISQIISLLLTHKNYLNIYWIYFPFLMLTIINFLLNKNEEKNLKN